MRQWIGEREEAEGRRKGRLVEGPLRLPHFDAAGR